MQIKLSRKKLKLKIYVHLIPLRLLMQCSNLMLLKSMLKISWPDYMAARDLLIFVFFVIPFCVSAQPQALSTKSKKAIELYTEADNFRVRGQFSQALRLLQEAIEKDKEFVE